VYKREKAQEEKGKVKKRKRVFPFSSLRLFLLCTVSFPFVEAASSSSSSPPKQVIQGKLPPQYPILQQSPPRPIHHYFALPPSSEKEGQQGRVVKAASSSSSKAMFWCFIEGEGALFGDFLIFGDFSRGRFLMDC
jgi:hypothetical protein